MSMRELIHTTLLNSIALDECGDRIYQRGAIGVGDAPADPEKPYIVIGELAPVLHPEVRKTAKTVSHSFQFHVYDERGSFLRIDRLLSVIRDSVLGLVAVTSASGARCTDTEWMDASGDLSDPTLDANAKFIIIRVTANR